MTVGDRDRNVEGSERFGILTSDLRNKQSDQSLVAEQVYSKAHSIVVMILIIGQYSIGLRA